MGKLTTTCFLTLDNVIDEPHRWSGAYFSGETGALNDEVMREADALVLGRETYEGFAAAWPSRSGDAFADKINAMPKYVVSTTLERADWSHTTILDADPFARIRELKADGNVLTWGSARLVQGLLAEGLVDELVLLYSPIVLGAGTRLFGEGARHEFEVVESRLLEGGMLAVRLAAGR